MKEGNNNITNTEFDNACEEVATTAFLACNAKREILEDIANMDEAELKQFIRQAVNEYVLDTFESAASVVNQLLAAVPETDDPVAALDVLKHTVSVYQTSLELSH